MGKRRHQVMRAVGRASDAVWPSAAEALRRAALRASWMWRHREGASLRPPVSRVVFACPHNAERSQMAAAFFNQLADPARARAIAAGTREGRSVDASVVEAMREAGVELGHALPRRLNSHVATAAGRVVTMGCREDCPFYPGVKLEDWPIDDPRGASRDRVREIRDQIRGRVEEMIQRNGWGPRPR
jgi:arsenate reductase